MNTCSYNTSILPSQYIFISWLNLDLGIETCFFDGLSAYSKVWLQFVFPVYIWSIAGLIIVLSRYSDRVAKVMGNNSVPVLATLFLLSYAKLLCTIISALSLSILTTTDGSKTVWSTDGNIDYLGAKHAPLFVAAVGALLFLWLQYTVLFFGQWLYRCNLKVVNSMLIKIKPFLDAHYGPIPSLLVWSSPSCASNHCLVFCTCPHSSCKYSSIWHKHLLLLVVLLFSNCI